jgi:Concanavalin A-like lectin/glucanases superfamily
MVLLPGGGVARASLSDGLVGYWKLDEASIDSGTVARDSSGRQHDCAYVNAPVSSSKVPGLRFGDPRSVSFVRATHQAVRLANMPAALKPAAVTISVWYLATSTDSDRAELVSGGDSYILYLAPTGLGAGRREAGTWSDVVAPVATVPALLDGQWHHAAATIDGTRLAVFFDGKPAASLPKAGAIVFDLGPDLWLGRYGNGTRARDFEGNLDEVAIFDRVLTASEIAELAQGAQPGFVVAAPDAGGGEDAGDGAADAGTVHDAAEAGDATLVVDVPAEAGGPANPDATAGTDGASNVEPAPSADAAPGADTAPAGPVAGLDAAPAVDAGVVPVPVGHHYRDAPAACSTARNHPVRWPGLLLLATLLAFTRGRRREGSDASLTGRRRRARSSRR